MHRSLSVTQRALIAAGFLGYEQALAKARMVAGAQQKGVENFPHPTEEQGKSRDKAGDRMGVSGRSVTSAKEILDKATPEVIAKVREGEMTLHQAKTVIGLNPDAQRKVATATKKERGDVLRRALHLSHAAKHESDEKTDCYIAHQLPRATRVRTTNMQFIPKSMRIRINSAAHDQAVRHEGSYRS